MTFSMSVTATKYHDFSCGHRVVGQGGKCEQLHGHNYRIHFTIKTVETESDKALVDKVGRVIDFGEISARLCNWLEQNWDHKFLMWERDPWIEFIYPIHGAGVVIVPFNPTAENMGMHLLQIADQLLPKGVILVECKVEETRKCSALCVRID